jgi:DNA repair exonuclease SbcCD ATPase subunit
MAKRNPQRVTLNTVHHDLTSGFADLKATLVTGFANLPTRESGEEMVRLLRESNRLQEERFTQLDLRIRGQHLEVQQVLRAVVEGQRLLVEGQRALMEGQHTLIEGQRSLIEAQRAMADEIRMLSGEIRSLSGDIKALIARLDALIKGRGDGGPTA